MAQPLLLMDFENIQTIDVHLLPSDYRIAIFYGANQKSASLDLTTRLQNLGSRVQWHRVTGIGKNALDFCMAFHISRVFERHEANEFVILARDKGYDPLVKPWRQGGDTQGRRYVPRRPQRHPHRRAQRQFHAAGQVCRVPDQKGRALQS
jgi:hypothetical protein